MILGTRIYWVLALVLVIALAGAAVTLTSGLTSAGGSDPAPAVQTCDQQDEGDDAEETESALDTDNVDEECGDQNAADDASEQHQSGALDDGKNLLPQAKITVDEAIAAARSAASGAVGEIDLEHAGGRLVFNVDVGDKDVKVDALDGSIVAVDSDD
jgi:uncharacterized membrane protein YkoI